MPESTPALVSRRDVVVAAISFAISGVGGAYFQRWLSRAKPSLDIVAIGFDGTSEPFRLSDQLRQISSDDNWGESLEQTATFDGLRARYRSTISLIKDHEKLIPITEKWLQGARQRLTGGAVVSIDATEIDAHAYFQDELFGSALLGNIRRLQVPDPPIVDTAKYDYRLTVLDKSDKAITVQNGRKVTRFPLTGMNSEQKRQQVRLMADSFAKGLLQNIIHYTEFFINGARADLLKLKALEEPLRDTLTREARLTVNVAFRNSGDSASVFRQYYSASLQSKQFSQVILLSPIEKGNRGSSNDGIFSRLAKEMSENEDSVVLSADADELSKILPSARGSQLQGVGAGEVRQVILQSLKPLGDDGQKIASLFQNDVVECQVFGFLANGAKVSSNLVPFGKSAIEREQQDALRKSS